MTINTAYDRIAVLNLIVHNREISLMNNGFESEKVLMAGFGGQGILFMGRLLSYTGMINGYEVTFIPSYGAEMRGGTANCNVIVSKGPIGSAIIEVPDSLIVMNQPSLDKFEPKLKKDGLIIVNKSLVSRDVERKDIKTVYVSATELAEEKLGSNKVANLVALGSYLKATGLFSFEDVSKGLDGYVPENKRKMLEINLKALELGFK